MAEIRAEKLNVGGRWVWMPMNPTPSSKLRSTALGYIRREFEVDSFPASHTYTVFRSKMLRDASHAGG